ncbi:MAG: hypothetical protein ACK4YP_11195 [Myxococcota bacterium]
MMGVLALVFLAGAVMVATGVMAAPALAALVVLLGVLAGQVARAAYERRSGAPPPV